MMNTNPFAGTAILFILAALLTADAFAFTPAPIARDQSKSTTSQLSVFGSRTPARTTKNSPLLDEALTSYPYQFKSDQDKLEKTQTFNEIARLYGDKEALQMVQICPQTLKFKRQNFAPCLDSWEEQFGLDAARAMVLRNPGLLGVRPEQTDGAESSMAFSYIVAVTRPLPKIIAVGGLLAILTAGMR
jgi:hypothetical protein